MILEKFRLDEQIAIVTGGTRGIGKAIALAMAEAGANVAVVSRSPAPDIEQKISALGRRYLHYSADLTLREQTREVVPAVVNDGAVSSFASRRKNNVEKRERKNHQYRIHHVLSGRGQRGVWCIQARPGRLTKALSNNWASKGINVNAIAPGFITTKFTSSRWKDPDFYNYVIQRTPVVELHRPLFQRQPCHGKN
jgi:2-deoxy-D-gluconate 3-dehydrogenase